MLHYNSQDNKHTYIIAEMSANHGQSLERAKEIIYAAKDAGADCIKLQTYTPDTLTINCDNPYFMVKNGTWKNEKLYELYSKAYTPWEWHSELKETARKAGIDFLSTPFDNTAVDFLENIGVEFYKIASFELVDLPLIKYIASKHKPIIMSTGMGNLAEIEDAVQTVFDENNYDLTLLKCSSAYPAITEDMNLKTMANMRQTFDVNVGLSDHSMGSIGAVTAVAMGASVIEKHFCLSRKIITPDSSFSMEPQEFSQMVKDVRMAEKAIGSISYGPSEKEKSSIVFRRSIFVTKDIKKGELLTPDNIRIIRPGNGLSPKYYNEILGQCALEDIKFGTPMKQSLIGQKQKKILFLTNNLNTLDLYSFLTEKGMEVILYDKEINIDYIKKVSPDFIISFNYSYIIPEDIIVYMKEQIVNLHISYLPYNRGASPNFFSFLDDSPKGVTIHRINKELDKGEILLRKKITFDESKITFEQSYDTLICEIIKLFKENWMDIINNNIQTIKVSENGSYHSMRELNEIKSNCEFNWSDNISETIKKIKNK